MIKKDFIYMGLLLAILVALIFLVCKPVAQAKTIETTTVITETVTDVVETATDVVEVEDKPKYKELGEFKLTAYCPCYECSEEYGRMTATGKIAKANHTVAVDPDVIPYGSVLMIDGHEYEYVAEDCGGLVSGKHLDIYFEDHSKVEQFGRQYATVFIRSDTDDR